MFGRVPLPFHVAHVLLIHVIAVLLGVAQGFNGQQFLTIFFFYPKGSTPSGPSSSSLSIRFADGWQR
jgi:hypothetical protein